MKKEIIVNIKRENPLVTILKAGKIPVIRRSKNGFQNYNQTEYFENYELAGPVFNGCFCFIGGIYGNYITGGHQFEPLNIGYVEPDTKVFSTYHGNRDNDFSIVTAKERYDKANIIHKMWLNIITNYGEDEIYKLLEEKILEENFPEDLCIGDCLELFKEAIVKAEDITPICSIPFKEYYTLGKYSGVGENAIFTEKAFFENISQLPKKAFEEIARALS